MEQTGITQLGLQAFRSYASYRWSQDPPKIVAVVGPNGTGKTNLLEAVSLLTPGRGLRGARVEEMQATATPQTPWRVAADITLPSGILDVQTHRFSSASSRRLIKIADHPLKTHSELSEYLYALWLTPQMETLFLEGNTARRRFLDRLVLGLKPRHGAHVSAYEKALRERQKLLETPSHQTGWLDGLETILAREGVQIVENRLEVVARLTQALENAPGPFPKARLELDGVLEGAISTQGPAGACQLFKGWMERHRLPHQRATEFALGAHKSLWRAFFPGDIPAHQASTGQQKILLMSIILGACQLHALEDVQERCFLLLLDDVMAHLDATHRRAFLETVVHFPFQVWLTGTEVDLLADVSAETSAAHILLTAPP
jgi:DNA replication and repair protein RecF